LASTTAPQASPQLPSLSRTHRPPLLPALTKRRRPMQNHLGTHAIADGSVRRHTSPIHCILHTQCIKQSGGRARPLRWKSNRLAHRRGPPCTLSSHLRYKLPLYLDESSSCESRHDFLNDCHLNISSRSSANHDHTIN
jgi:hypothetical protein